MVVAAAGVLGWVAYHASIARELSRARHETSRFPMFAARDSLVALVACGRMSEDDASWRTLYDGVNFVLNIHQKLHMLDCVSKYMDHMVQVQKNPALRAAIRKAIAREEYAARRIPEFAAARDEIREAFRHLIERRTTRSHKMVLLVLYVTLTLVKISLWSGVKTARIVRKSVFNPSYDAVLAWPSVEHAAA
jgi:hypothetical protein